MAKKKKIQSYGIFALLVVLACVFIYPILLVIQNSFKGKLFISNTPFELPNKETFVGVQNYVEGFAKTNFHKSFGYSLFITIFSVLAIVLFTSMTAWYITRVKSKLTSTLYYIFLLSMVVPFQMVMYTMSKLANTIYLDNPVGIIVLYLGFGSGMAVFMFSGFIKGIPVELEEATLIDGCNPIKMFFKVILPVLKPILITVAILDAMWIWNDFLLPYLILGSNYRTIPVAIQYLKSGYGSIDYGQLMAMIVLSLIPIVAFYFACQKHIIEGIVAGAVKG